MGLVSQPSCSNVAACIKLQVTLSISTPALEMRKYQYYLVKTHLRFAQQKLKPIRSMLYRNIPHPILITEILPYLISSQIVCEMEAKRLALVRHQSFQGSNKRPAFKRLGVSTGFSRTFSFADAAHALASRLFIGQCPCFPAGPHLQQPFSATRYACPQIYWVRAKYAAQDRLGQRSLRSHI